MDLSVEPGDYGQPRFYSGSSSSGDTDPWKERSYKIARALSDTKLACGFNYRDVGILPDIDQATAKFVDFCAQSHALPEMERDLLTVDSTNLAEASAYHQISVSFRIPPPFAFAFVLFR